MRCGRASALSSPSNQYQIVTSDGSQPRWSINSATKSWPAANFSGRRVNTSALRRGQASSRQGMTRRRAAIIADCASITKIAANKAGILKDGVPCVVGPQPSDAIAVIEARAAETASTLFRHGRDWTVRETSDGLIWRDKMVELALPRPALLGAHQVINAGVAIACARHLTGFTISADAIAAGLRQVDWPARMQRLTRGPLIDLLRVLLKLRCDEFEVAQKLIANASDLERIAADDHAKVPALTGWRKKVFGEEALALKHGKLALTAKGKSIKIISLE